MAKSALSFFFKQCPLSGPVFLVTSLEEGKSENIVTFGPPCSSKRGASVASRAHAPKIASCISSEGTVQSADLGFTVERDMSFPDMFVTMCGGCFEFLGVIASGCSGPQRQDDARELEELKRTVEELSSRIEQLESEKRQKGSIKKSAKLN